MIEINLKLDLENEKARQILGFLLNLPKEENVEQNTKKTEVKVTNSQITDLQEKINKAVENNDDLTATKSVKDTKPTKPTKDLNYYKGKIRDFVKEDVTNRKPILAEALNHLGYSKLPQVTLDNMPTLLALVGIDDE